MPLQDDLITHIQSGRFPEAQQIIDKNPSIVNETFAYQASFLMAVFACVDDSDPLIQFIESNLPRLNNLNYIQPVTKKSIFDDAVLDRSPKMVKLFIDHHQEKSLNIFEKGDKLQWEIVNKRIEDTRTGIFRKEELGKDTTKDCAKRDRLRAIAELLLEATVREAFRLDDATLLNRLHQAGADVNPTLDDYNTAKTQAKILGKKNLIKFYEQFSLEKSLAALLSSGASLTDNTNTLFSTQSALEEAKNEYAEAQSAVIAQANQNTKETDKRVEETASFGCTI